MQNNRVVSRADLSVMPVNYPPNHTDQNRSLQTKRLSLAKQLRDMFRPDKTNEKGPVFIFEEMDLRTRPICFSDPDAPTLVLPRLNHQPGAPKCADLPTIPISAQHPNGRDEAQHLDVARSGEDDVLQQRARRPQNRRSERKASGGRPASADGKPGRLGGWKPGAGHPSPTELLWPRWPRVRAWVGDSQQLLEM